jgi:peptide/nickel transport system ATP-binding protein
VSEARGAPAPGLRSDEGATREGAGAKRPAASEPGALLEVRDLRVSFATEDGVVKAVDGLSFGLDSGRTLAIVGESGSGKTVTGRALTGLATGAAVGGQVLFEGRDLLTTGKEDLRKLRGSEIAMVFQDPLSALNPYYTVGQQIGEAYRAHKKVSRRDARAHAVHMLNRVGIPNPDRRAGQYPHEFSGGMRQRVMIAMALACDPKLLIADEPTTALDVTVQAQILDLLGELQREFGTSIIMITHDLGVVASVAHDVLVMYAGRAVEHAPVEELFAHPQHPYTWGLLDSIARVDDGRADRLRPIAGSPPSLISVPPGCPFHPRCPHRVAACDSIRPELASAAPGHDVACHLDADVRNNRGMAVK